MRRAGAVPPGRAPVLALALGNPLMGDDGVGERLVGLLAREAGLEGRVETASAGCDLLAAAPLLAGRRVVLLVDAVAAEPGEAPGGAPLLLDPLSEALDPFGAGAHALSAAGCLRLLAAVEPALAAIDFRLFGVPITGARVGEGLSPELEARLPALAARLAEECRRAAPGRAPGPAGGRKMRPSRPSQEAMHSRRNPLRGPGSARPQSLRRRRDRRFAVRLHHAGRPEQKDLLRRLRGPSSWRCAPHAHPHPEREAEPL